MAGRANASNNRGPWFEPSRRAILYYINLLGIVKKRRGPSFCSKNPSFGSKSRRRSGRFSEGDILRGHSWHYFLWGNFLTEIIFFLSSREQIIRPNRHIYNVYVFLLLFQFCVLLTITRPNTTYFADYFKDMNDCCNLVIIIGSNQLTVIET